MTNGTAMATKPDYLGLLNQISLAESRAGEYLRAWAEVTPNPQLREALSFVAGRESSHGVVFCQLIQRLGFSLREKEDPKFAEQLRIYGDPNVSDREKIRYGRYGREEGAIERFFASLDERINDESVDALTRDTLRWYVHEERDSGKLLEEAYACVEGMDGGSNGKSTVSADAQALMECMSQGFASLQQSIKELAETLGKQAKSR
jgi:rubrerythrin